MFLYRVFIRLTSFNNELIDCTVNDIIESIKETSLKIYGPIPLPIKIRKFTLLTSPHIDKDSRDQYELRVHKRLLIICSSADKTTDALMSNELSSGVDVSVSVK